MIVSAIISAIAFTTIIIVTIIITNQTKFFKTDFQTRLRNVVDQINTSQQYTYEFDKKQQQQITSIDKNIDDVRLSYVNRNELSNQLITKRVIAENVNAQNISLTGTTDTNNTNNGAIQFNSQLPYASKSQDYTIQRGGSDSIKNHLVIKTSVENGSGLNIMSSDGQSRMLIDSSTGTVKIPGNIKANTIQFGDKLKLTSVGVVNGENDWLNMIGSDSTDYKGGLAASKIWTKNKAYLNGDTNINGKATVSGTLNISGGLSEYNINNLQTQFNGPNNKNYIRGDTEITGNTNNIGNINIGKNAKINNSLNVNGDTTLSKTVKINHTQNGWQDGSSLSVYSKPGSIGASFGSSTVEGEASHFPWTDGNTYIRPGQKDKSVVIGDWGAKNINVGNNNSTTNINGVLNINNSGITNNNGINIQVNDKDKGIYSTGQKDFGIYTNNTKRININKDGKIINYGDIVAPSIGRDTSDNELFNININQANNTASKGTAVHNNLSISDGGGLTIGDFTTKTPEGQAYIRDSLKIRKVPVTNKLTDGTNAAITTWTDNSGTQTGASFGGPDNWSHLPYIDGNTYIRSGKKNKGSVLIGDMGTDNVSIGQNDGSTNINIGNSLTVKDGSTFIRQGKNGTNISIGDNMTTNDINIGTKGSSGNVYTKSKTHYVSQEIDATDSWGNSGKTLFAGWNSDTVILGNNKTASSDAISKLPKGSVISANDLYVNGASTSASKVCVNSQCLTENDILNLKNLVRAETTTKK